MPTDIIRKPTAQEALDFEDISRFRTKKPKEIFKKKVTDIEQQATKDKKPFCAACAFIDFQDINDKLEKEINRGGGAELTNVIKQIDGIDLTKYGKASYFDNVKDQEMYDKNPETGRVELTHYSVDYKCKPRRHGISVFIPKEDYKKPVEK